jgi:cysteinyl-tRNA synthetase
MVLYNTLSRKKEVFVPLNKQHAGLYVCGPTVYGDPHLGHARTAITFDLLHRYLRYKGYKVRYVRNITDVGHLENDMDEGEDKIGRQARLEQLEPMEIAQFYTYRYRNAMAMLGILPPSIEPLASGHIPEQIALVQRIMDAGYAYVGGEGSVYFDVEKYSRKHNYGILSGRSLDEMLSGTRALDGQQEKHGAWDFALWKQANERHIMKWQSPWSAGFPGWHVECSAMSSKYLGESFDIHGGGMDLLFPHHECEIAQNTAAFGSGGAKVWLHSNMITISKQKMGKSIGNVITLEQLFNGSHPLLHQAYSPMTLRLFALQAHYRSTLDFSNEALQAAEKGFSRLQQAYNVLQNIIKNNTAAPQHADENCSDAVNKIAQKCYEALDDDLNSPIAIAQLFDAVRMINAASDGKEAMSSADAAALGQLFDNVIVDILGLSMQKEEAGNAALLGGVLDLLLELRQVAKHEKNYAQSDRIRNRLHELGIAVNDGKNGSTWQMINN